MANQEGIDIIIKAQDQYTATINKIDASTKIFGKTTENTQKQVAALEKYMITLVSNGLDPADKKILQLKADYDKLTQSLNSSQGTLKSSSKQWTSLALVVQDLPYGFRGIQNNLPALFGSIAAAAGPAYFAFSALVALVTAYEKELRALFITTTAAEKQQELLNNVVKESGSAYVDAQTQVLSLTQKVKLAKEGYFDKQSVVDEYNKTIGETIGQQKTLEGVNQALINQGPAYVDYMNKLAMAVAASKLVAQETENIIKTSAKSASEFVSGFEAFFSGKLNLGGMVQSMMASSEAALKIGQKNKKSQLTTAEQTRLGYVKIMEDMYKAAGEAAKKAGVVPGVNKGQESALKKSIEQQQRVNEQVIQNLIDAKKQEVKLFEDDAYAKYEASRQLVELEKKLALEKLNNAGYTAKQIAALEVGIYQERDNKIVLLGEALQVQILGQDAKTRKEKKRRDQEDLKAQQQFGNNQVDLIDSQLKVGLRLNKDNIIGQQELIQQSMAKVGVMMAASFGTGQFPVLLKYYDELNAKLLAMDTAALRGAEAMKRVNSIISDTATNAVVQLGENIGKALGGEKVDLFGGFIELLSSGLQEIGKALIAYGVAMDAFKKAFSNPYAAIAAGIALVAAGAFLKSKINKTSGGASSGPTGNVPAFANGGIISGPTMGLMGEYPGAKSNPEVVAPLDKLKDLIGGGGGGTFVLRGQDLLLSVNRAQKASNIKGQIISLA
jgi:hypothetical protein